MFPAASLNRAYSGAMQAHGDTALREPPAVAFAAEIETLRAEFGALVPEDTITSAVEQEADRFLDARVTDFVPMFVMRGARARLGDIVRARSK